ncbi:MAG: hypothetical protein HUU15_16625, partial [Candidatus Brocadiae bacterium]|nr:hypothetical protein [Candidatus Brocadiia bacterium]
MVLSLRSIQSWAPSGTYALGARDLRDGRVSGLRKSTGDLWCGQVLGPKDRPVNVELDLGPRAEHFCEGDCEGVCRHIIALALAVAGRTEAPAGDAAAHWEDRLGALASAC